VSMCSCCNLYLACCQHRKQFCAAEPQCMELHTCTVICTLAYGDHRHRSVAFLQQFFSCLASNHHPLVFMLLLLLLLLLLCSVPCD
jgi:hypothetical protein